MAFLPSLNRTIWQQKLIFMHPLSLRMSISLLIGIQLAYHWLSSLNWTNKRLSKMIFGKAQFTLRTNWRHMNAKLLTTCLLTVKFELQLNFNSNLSHLFYCFNTGKEKEWIGPPLGERKAHAVHAYFLVTLKGTKGSSYVHIVLYVFSKLRYFNIFISIGSSSWELAEYSRTSLFPATSPGLTHEGDLSPPEVGKLQGAHK